MKTRHSMMFMAIMITISAVVMILAGFTPAEASHQANDRLVHADKQLEALVELGSNSVVGPLSSVVKWQGNWKTTLSANAAAQQLAIKLGLSVPKREMVQDHTVYAAEQSTGQITSKLSVMEMEGGQLYIVFLMNATVTTNQVTDLQTAEHQAGAILLSSGVDAKWNGAVQGLASNKVAVTGSTTTVDDSTNVTVNTSIGAAEMLKSMEQNAAKLQPTALDSFSDGTTISRTYMIPSFFITAEEGEKGFSGLQMAVHTDTVTGQQEVSFGSPMLTIEY